MGQEKHRNRKTIGVDDLGASKPKVILGSD
jgi:hypothetical protein